VFDLIEVYLTLPNKRASICSIIIIVLETIYKMSKLLMIVSCKSAGKPNRGGLVGAQHNGQVCAHYLYIKDFLTFFQ
jgi:hypothetical protein